MISAEILLPALFLLNLIPIVLLFFIHRKLAVREIRRIFSLLILAGILWGNSTLLYRYDGWDAAVRSQLIHLNFVSAIILAHIFLAFFIQFTENGALFKKPVFWLMTANTVGIAVVCTTDLVVTSFEITPEKIRLHYGLLYPWYVASAVILEGFGVYLLAQAYRKATSELFKFQTGIVIRYTIITFALVLLSNVALPLLLKTSRYSFAGPFIALFFFLGVFRILFRGTRLYVLQALDRLMQTVPFALQENILALREAIQFLKAAITGDADKMQRQVVFGGMQNERIDLLLGKNIAADSSALTAEPAVGAVQNWFSGFRDTIRLLENDNRSLALTLIKAEGILQEQWLSDTVEKLPVRTTPAGTDALEIHGRLSAILKNVADNRETFGVEICTLSRTMFKQMSEIAGYARGNQLIIIEGEPGTGKASMARAVDFFRFKKHSLIEIHCQNGNIDALTRRISEVTQEIGKSKVKTGVLIRNMDFLPLDMISIFNPIFDLDQEKTYLYITSAPDYLRNLEGLSDTLFHRLNQIRVQLPPLRRREDDLTHLIFWYAAYYSAKMNIPFTHISQAFLDEARRLSWQGNIVELQNTLQRELLNNKSPVLSTFHVSDPHALAAPGEVLTPLERAERKVIVDYLKKNNFNKNRTRIELDITVNTLNAKIIKYGIELPE